MASAPAERSLWKKKPAFSLLPGVGPWASERCARAPRRAEPPLPGGSLRPGTAAPAPGEGSRGKRAGGRRPRCGSSRLQGGGWERGRD